MKQLSYIYAYISSLLDFPATPFHSSRSSQSTEVAIMHVSASYFTHGSAYVNPNLPAHPTLPFPSCIHIYCLHTWISIPALKIGACMLSCSGVSDSLCPHGL